MRIAINICSVCDTIKKCPNWTHGHNVEHLPTNTSVNGEYVLFARNKLNLQPTNVTFNVSQKIEMIPSSKESKSKT